MQVADGNMSLWQNGRVLHLFSDAPASLPFVAEEHFTNCGEMHGRRLNFQNADILGASEFVQLEPGLFLTILDFDLPSPLHSALVGENLIEFHYRLSGNLSLKGRWGHVSLQRPSLLIWSQPTGHNDVWEELGACNIRELSVTLYCTKEWLGNMIAANDERISYDLAAFISGSNNDVNFEVLPPSFDAIGILESILQEDATGSLRLWNLKAKGYQLLVASIKALSGSTELDLSGLTTNDRNAIQKAVTILSSSYTKPPSLPKLARMVGINSTKLSFGLKAVTGKGYKEMIRNLRLENAMELLKSTDLQIGQIAEMIGYSHHSTFTTAFVSRYQVAPKDLINRTYIA